LNKIYEIQ